MMLGALTSSYEKLPPEKRAAMAAALKLDPRLSARELAQAQVNKAIRSYVRPAPKTGVGRGSTRRRRVCHPHSVGHRPLHPRFLFASHPQGWEGQLWRRFVVGLYAWPHRWLKSPEYSEFRIMWWALPFAVALAGA